MTLREIYEKAKQQPRPDTPANALIKQIAEVTKKSEITVRRWLTEGETQCVPDNLTQEVLARHFNTTPQELFPN